MRLKKTFFPPATRLKMRLPANESSGITIFPEKTDLESTGNWLELVSPETQAPVNRTN